MKILQTFKEKTGREYISLKEIIVDKKGQLLSEHAGWIAVAFVLIGVALYFAYPALKNDVLPALKDKVMNLINYSG
jgi:hypothetical protein